MSEQSEMDYEKQFHDDLAKATALSLEQQALDDYNRSKKYGQSTVYYESVHKNHTASVKEEYSAQLQLKHESFTRSKSVTGNDTIRHSALENAVIATTNTSPPTVSAVENDLISFNSPTTQKPNEQQTFEKLIKDLQKFQTTSHSQMALMPKGLPLVVPRQTHMGSYAETQTNFIPGAAAYGSALQLLPYMPTTSSQKMPLTNENLQQLYNMPYGPHYAPPTRPPTPAAYPMGFVTGPTVSAAFMPPQNPRYPYEYSASMPYEQKYPAITNSSTAVTAAAPTFPLPIHCKIGPKTAAGTESNASHSTSAGGDNSGMRRHSRTATGDDLIDLNQNDEYVYFR